MTQHERSESSEGKQAAMPTDPHAAEAAELVARIARGDRDAEARLVEIYAAGLGYLLRRLARDPELAEDLRQETLRIALEKARAGELREPERVAGFLRGTARHLLLAERRKASRRPTAVDPESVPEPADPARGPFDHALAAQDRLRVRRLLGELASERDREVLFRFHIAEEPRELICEALGLSRSQLNLILFRARRRFRALVEERGMDPEITDTS